MRSGYMAIRAPGSDRIDSESNVISSGHPDMPSTWYVKEIHRKPIPFVVYKVETDDGLVLHVFRMNARPDQTKALYGVMAEDRTKLDELAAYNPDVAAAPMQTVWANRNTNETARLALLAWRDYVIDGTVRVGTDEGTGDPITKDVTEKPWRLNYGPDGTTLPDPQVTPLPWLLGKDASIVATQDEAWVHVTAIHRPTLLHTVAGWNDTAGFETTT